ncbi:MAG: hypothetical protein HYY84_13300 [Deltaproteobacteria bacterium]|nr:hypothetical protein [Deltaproteobacteria bacterium]
MSLLIALLAAAACGQNPGEEWSLPPSGPRHVSGSFPGRVSEGRAALVGTWEVRDTSDRRVESCSIDANGAFTCARYTSAGTAEESATGTMTVTGDTFTTTGRLYTGAWFRSTGTFYVDDRFLTTSAYRRDSNYSRADHNHGAVGHWVRNYDYAVYNANGTVQDGASRVIRISILADGTATVTTDRWPTFEATYIESPAGTFNLTPRLPGDGSVPMQLVLLDGSMLSEAKHISTRVSN